MQNRFTEIVQDVNDKEASLRRNSLAVVMYPVCLKLLNFTYTFRD